MHVIYIFKIYKYICNIYTFFFLLKHMPIRIHCQGPSQALESAHANEGPCFSFLL